MDLLFTIFAILAVAFIFIILPFWIVTGMASDRHRDAGLWLIASFFITPLLAIILLFFLGDKD